MPDIEPLDFRYTAATAACYSQIAAAPSSSQNDYSPTGWATATHLSLVPTASIYISGFEAREAGAWCMVSNDSTFLISIGTGLTASSAANRIVRPGNGSGQLILFPGDEVLLRYDGVNSRWVAYRQRWLLRESDSSGLVRWMKPTAATLTQDTSISSTGGTLTTPTPTTASRGAARYRFAATTTTSITAVAGIRHADTTPDYLPSAASGFGGFASQFGFWMEVCPDAVADTFMGFASGTSPGAGNPYSNSSMGHTFGVGWDNGDTAFWRIMRNDGSGSATRTSLGAGFPVNATALMRIAIWNPPSAARFSCIAWREDDATVLPAIFDVTDDLPTAAMGLFMQTTNRSAASRTLNLDAWGTWTD